MPLCFARQDHSAMSEDCPGEAGGCSRSATAWHCLAVAWAPKEIARPFMRCEMTCIQPKCLETSMCIAWRRQCNQQATAKPHETRRRQHPHARVPVVHMQPSPIAVPPCTSRDEHSALENGVRVKHLLHQHDAGLYWAAHLQKLNKELWHVPVVPDSMSVQPLLLACHDLTQPFWWCRHK